MMVKHLIALLMAMTAALAQPSARAQSVTAFTVKFTNCTEFAGWGPVALANASPLVPKSFTIAGANAGNAAIVVRATSCASAKVGNYPAIPTHLSQIGINLTPPDGTGDINNYTLIYVSDNPYLVFSFLAAGLPARLDPGLTYEYTPNGTATGGALYVTAQGDGLPPFFLYGAETEPPPNSQQPFLANWWYTSAVGQMKQSTNFPSISFGTSSVALYTSAASELGQLIGGNQDGNFPILSVRGVYPAAQMVVTLKR
jgi:hypothetical protein